VTTRFLWRVRLTSGGLSSHGRTFKSTGLLPDLVATQPFYFCIAFFLKQLLSPLRKMALKKKSLK